MEKVENKLLVYGTGNHLQDMLIWHPELHYVIGRIFDKDMQKVGKRFPGTDNVIEPCSALEALPEGTVVAVSALRYFEEIRQELGQMNPGLVCMDIDTVYEELALSCVRAARTPASREIPASARWQRILVFRLDMLGDVLMTMPLLREIRRMCPQAELDFVVRRENLDLLRNCRYVSRVIPFPSAEVDIFQQGQRRDYLEKSGLAGAYDVVFLPGPLLTGSACLAELLLAMECRAQCRVGRIYASEEAGCVLRRPLSHKDLLDSMFTSLLWHKEPQHEVDCILDMLIAAGGQVSGRRMEYWLGSAEQSFAERIWQECGVPAGAVAIAVGLVSRGKNRTWAAGKYVQLWKRLRDIDKNLYFVLLGGEDAEEAASLLRGEVRVIDLTGRTTLPEAAACIARCSFYLGVDTGLLHFASALGKPIVEITAWAAEASPYKLNATGRVGPYGVWQEICCAGTGYTPAETRAAANDPEFIDTVTVEMVYAAVVRMLERIGR